MKNIKSKLFYLFFFFICFLVPSTCKKIDKSMLVSTGDITNILATSADAPGMVIDLGGGATQHGHCYGTTPNITIGGMKTQLGTAPLGGFTSQLTSLTPGTLYYYKAYMTNGDETVYGDEKSFTTLAPSIPTLSTSETTEITMISATSGGNVTNDGGAAITARGVCWNTSANPTVALATKTTDGVGNGAFTSKITGLSAGTTYYVRAYATNSKGIAYGSDLIFTTQAILLPTVATTAVTLIATTTAVSGGNVTNDGGATVTTRGVCWSTSTAPTILDNKKPEGSGTGIFTSNLTGLTVATKYYMRAYATNSAGTAYGSEVSFTTQNKVVPTITTNDATNIDASSAMLGGNVTSDGNSEVTERGICYNTTQNPTIADNPVIIGAGTGAFSQVITGLITGTTYYVKAYATNSLGTAYGPQITFTTTNVTIPTVATSDATSIGTTSVILGGNVTSSGNTTVTDRGICYSTVQNPTIADNPVGIGNGTGVFSNTISGLAGSTTYYVRAYATNSQGTAYGLQISFTTIQILLPTITTAIATSIESTTAMLGGNVTSDGGSTVTDRGICYNIQPNPTTANNPVNIGSGTGTFSSTLAGLTGNTTYYVRAYATNIQGTNYGNEVSFKTGIAISIASLTTSTPINITINSATVGGEVTSDGNSAVTERGICYSTGQSPTVANSKISVGTGIGSFSTPITGLVSNTAYYVRAYAINAQGAAYGNEVSFTTKGSVPTVTTKDVSNILETSAIGGGIVVSDGGAGISERGVCYSTSANPTVYDYIVINSSGATSFSCPLNILVPNTTYNIRAYAISSNGVGYGENKTFLTLDAYYAGFENGMPTGWTGMWTVSTEAPMEGFSCLKSGNPGDSIVFTRNIVNPLGGQISFYHKSSCDWYSCNETLFYIDNVLQSTLPAKDWNLKTYPIMSGTHKFKWINKGGGSNDTYIDYFICPK